MSKIIVYTVIMGGYDVLPTITPDHDNIEYYCFTDVIPANTNGWTCIYIPSIFKDNKLNTQYLKTNPHLIFPWDSTIVWVDSNIEILEISKSQIFDMLDGQSIAALPHKTRHFFYGEAAVVADHGLDSRNKIAKWEIELKSMGFPDIDNLAELNFLIRDLRDPDVRKFNRTWWDFLLTGSRRDQLSFTPALWNHNLKWRPIKADRLDVKRTSVFKPNFKPHFNSAKRVISNTSPAFEVSDFSPYAWTEFADSKNKSGALANHYLYTKEYWTQEILEQIRMINGVLEEQNIPVKENYFYIEKKNIGRFTMPDVRLAWKREYLKKAVLPARYGIEIGFGQGHSSALMLAYNPNLFIIAVETSTNQASQTFAQKLISIYNTRLEVYFSGIANIFSDLSNKLPLENLEFVHYNTPDNFDETEFKEIMEWYLCKASVGCRLIISDIIPEIDFILSRAHTTAIINQLNPGVPNISDNRQYIKYSQMSGESFQKLFSFDKTLMTVKIEIDSIRARNAALQKINDELTKELRIMKSPYYYLAREIKRSIKKVLKKFL